MKLVFDIHFFVCYYTKYYEVYFVPVVLFPYCIFRFIYTAECSFNTISNNATQSNLHVSHNQRACLKGLIVLSYVYHNDCILQCISAGAIRLILIPYKETTCLHIQTHRIYTCTLFAILIRYPWLSQTLIP